MRYNIICYNSNTISRFYVVIGVTDVKDYTSNNMSYCLGTFHFDRLRAQPTQIKYKNSCFKTKVDVNRR